jgi:hypothetical protein
MGVRRLQYNDVVFMALEEGEKEAMVGFLGLGGSWPDG